MSRDVLTLARAMRRANTTVGDLNRARKGIIEAPLLGSSAAMDDAVQLFDLVPVEGMAGNYTLQMQTAAIRVNGVDVPLVNAAIPITFTANGYVYIEVDTTLPMAGWAVAAELPAEYEGYRVYPIWFATVDSNGVVLDDGTIKLRRSSIVIATGGFRKIFDLQEITLTPGDPEAENPDPSIQFSVLVPASAVTLAGTEISVTDDDSEFTIYADAYVWIKVMRDGQAFLEVGDTPPASTALQEVYKLWDIRITEDGGLDMANTVKLRESAIHVTTWSS